MTAPFRGPSADCARGWQAKADAGFVEQACQAVLEGRRAARLLARWCKPFGLSEADFQVLWSLRIDASEGIDQSTLAKRLVLSPAQVSATVERLRAQGWIAQQDLPHDRRRRLWQLSAAGQAMLQRMLAGATALRVSDGAKRIDAARAPAADGYSVGEEAA